jgi:uncharacterized repeat protein (TIGR01451 family)
VIAFGEVLDREKEGRMRRLVRRGILFATVMALITLPFGRASAAPLTTEDLSGALTPDDLANALVGVGVTVSNVTYTGADIAAGTFGGGTGIVGFDGGIVLSSGDIANVIGPNVADNITADNGTAGDADLDTLSGFTTFDASVLEFDFVPDSTPIRFQYVFSSDEYNEYVNTEFNDVFAFFVNGSNCATIDDDPVSINTINNGNPFGTDPRSHPELYVNNDLNDGGGAIDTEMDGLTVVLTCESAVNVGVANHMKLAIADASDGIYDSNVFLQAGSLTTADPLTTGKTADASSTPAGGANGYTITVSNPNASAISLDTITDTLPDGFAYQAGSTSGVTTADPSVAGQGLTWSGPFTVPASGQVSLHFGVTVSSVPGDYLNEAGGTSEAGVTGTGPTAPVTVTEIGGEDQTPPSCTKIAFSRHTKTSTLAMQDGESGLGSISVLSTTNATVSIAAFEAGTTDPVQVVVQRDPHSPPDWGAVFELRDAAGNVTVCNSRGHIQP